MAKYKVKALSVGAKGNQIFKSGDVVEGDKFNDAEALVKAGFLEVVEAKKVAPKVEEKKEEPKEEVKKPAPRRRKK